MSSVRVEIDSLKIKAKGISAAQARQLAEQLGGAISDAVARSGITDGRHVSEISLDAVQAKGRSGSAIAREIGAGVAQSISGRETR